MKGAGTCLVIAAVALVAGCLEKPAPWTPSEGDVDAALGDSQTADGGADLSTEASADHEVALDVVDVHPDVSGTDCTASCDGKECGDNWCGGSCGQCTEGEKCSGAGQCVSYCDWLCESLSMECGTTGAPDNCYCGDCDDKNGCTDDSCKAGKCLHADTAHPCDDGDPCTLGDACSGGNCTGQKLDCDDKNVCTTDKCVDGECLTGKNEAPCDDGDACTVDDVCADKVCKPGEPKDCNDGNDCTEDSCDAQDGCVHTKVSAGDCDDGNPCTVGDKCQEGVCTGNLLGRDQVTVQECICGTDEDCEKLNDDNPCNGTLECVEETGTCGVVAGSPLDCADKFSCTVDSCDPAEGCKHLSDDSFCDDKNICTDEHCEEMKGCVSAFNTASCDDNNACTDGDACAGGQCTPGLPVILDDGNICTDDTCDPAEGSKHTPNTAPCDDGNACTTDDVCQNGTCSGLGNLDCSDGEDCTDDSCDAQQGCIHVANADQCDDGDECTLGDQCIAKVCTPGLGAPDCEDDNQCTSDLCDSLQGCLHTKMNQGPCDDGNACTGADTCIVGICTGGPALLCEDDNPCTSDSCLPASGCVNAPVQDGTNCGDGMVCQAGACQPAGPLEDLDHDGVCPLAECAVQEPDSCPTTWNPDNEPATCEPLPDGFSASRPVVLTQPDTITGASTWHRTHEPVEVPLWNGIIDDSVVGYWKLDGDAEDSGPLGHGGAVKDGSPVDGVFGDAGGAMVFDGGGSGILVTDPAFPYTGQLTAMVWFRTDGDGGVLVAFNHPGTNGQDLLSVASGADGGYVEWRIESPGDNDWAFLKSAADGLADGKWHHVAGIIRGTEMQVFVDGRLEGTGQAKAPYVSTSLCSVTIGWVHLDKCQFGSPDAGSYLAGAIDEVLLFNRALTPDEIAAYYHSHAPYGTKFTPGEQPDFDDLRVTETTLFQDEHQVPFEIIGPRPHSDTPCPYDDSDPSKVPHIENREDLCGVVAYWKLDGDGKDVTGKHDGTLVGPTPARGRFADEGGALFFGGDAEKDSISLAAGGSPPILKDFTIEVWFRKDAPGFQYLLDTRDPAVGIDGLAVMLDDGPLLCSIVGAQGKAWGVCRPADISLGRWHHHALVRRAGKLEVYVDGRLLTEGQTTPWPSIADASVLGLDVPLFPAGAGRLGISHLQSLKYAWPGAIDDVLIHAAAKSPEYIYRWANPGVPMVRFLASTEPEKNADNLHDWYEYALHWGDRNAAQRPPILAGLEPDQECYGLLSPCLGYAGWWRFNEGSGTVAVDSSTWKNSGEIHGGATSASPAAGGEATALVLDGLDDWVTVPSTAAIQPQTEITAETHDALNPSLCANPGGKAHGLLSSPYCKGSDAVSSFLLVAYGKEYPDNEIEPPEALRAHVTTSKGFSNAFTDSGSVLEDAQWRAHRMTFDGAALSVWAGEADSGVAASGFIEYPQTPTTLYIGVSPNSCNGTVQAVMHGLLDSVRLMSRALTPDEFLHYPMAEWELGDTVCHAACIGNVCGPDGCGGTCGQCGAGNGCANGQCLQLQPSCTAWKKAHPALTSGWYEVKPAGLPAPESVWCDMDTPGGPWMRCATIEYESGKWIQAYGRGGEPIAGSQQGVMLGNGGTKAVKSACFDLFPSESGLMIRYDSHSQSPMGKWDGEYRFLFKQPADLTSSAPYGLVGPGASCSQGGIVNVDCTVTSSDPWGCHAAFVLLGSGTGGNCIGSVYGCTYATGKGGSDGIWTGFEIPCDSGEAGGHLYLDASDYCSGSANWMKSLANDTVNESGSVEFYVATP